MQIDMAYIRDLARLSLTRPRSAARQLLTIGAGYRAAFLAAAIAATVSAFIAAVLYNVLPMTTSPEMVFAASRPLLLALLQAMGMVLFAGLVTGIGRLFGGKGRMEQSLLLLAWFDLLIQGLQLAMLVLIFAIPAFGTLASILVVVLVLWVLASFIAELHGFASTARTLAGMIGIVIFAGMALALVLPPQ